MEDGLNFELEHFQLQQPGPKLNDKNERVERNSHGPWEEIDIIKMVETEKLLYSTNSDELMKVEPDLKDEEKVFDSFLNMNQATMLNIENSFKDVNFQNQQVD